MSGIPESFAESHLDRWGQEADGLTRDKISDTGTLKAEVLSYDQISHTALVRPLRAGYGDPIRVRVQTDYIGAVKGAGKATALTKGVVVDIEFVDGVAYGLYGQGHVTGATFTKDSHPGPAYAPWHQDGTGSVDVRELPDGRLGNARHESAKSEVSETNMGSKSTEDWGNDHVVAIGENITRAEEQLREAGNVIGIAAKLLSQEVRA